jgi:hypothetical protein
VKVKRELKKVWIEHYASALPLVHVQFHPADVINSLQPTYVPQKMPYSQYDLLKNVYEKYVYHVFLPFFFFQLFFMRRV